MTIIVIAFFHKNDTKYISITLDFVIYGNYNLYQMRNLRILRVYYKLHNDATMTYI